MLRLRSEITIGRLRFTYVTNVNISSSWNTLTDTAVIELPSKITNKDNTYIKDIIKVNDVVTIKLGYHPNLTTRFTGYVAKVIPESPLKVICEDEAFALKQQTIKSYSKKDISLETLISDLYEGEYSVADIPNIGTFRVTNASMIKVLQELKTKHKIQSWFRDGILYSGLAYIPGTGSVHSFKFQRNIIDGRNLVKQDADELSTIAHGVSVQGSGTKIELYTYYSGDEIVTSTTQPEGDLNTISLPGYSVAQLTELLERWLPNLYYKGFDGVIETFGEPAVNHGDIAEIEDLKFPEKDGKYIIERVDTEFGIRGFRQKLHLNLQTT